MANRLTPRQERFCLAWFKTKGIARHAYMAAGYSVTDPRVADVCASRLLTNARVQSRLEELKTMVLHKAADVTADTLTTELEEARQLALREGQAAAAVSATTAKGKLTGLLIERRESGKPGDFEGWSQAELVRFLETGESPHDRTGISVGEEIPAATAPGSDTAQ